MTNSKSMKKALFTSSLSLLLCFTMLIGTTFAWFTDSVTTANNIITAGNLDVELYYQYNNENTWTKVDKDTNVFKTGTLWEPGHAEVVKLKVVNEGSLALKYQLGVNVVSETGSINAAGKEFKLSEYIKYGIVDGGQNYNTSADAATAAEATASKLNVAYNSGNISLDAKGGTTDEKTVTMIVYMPTTVGNEANYGKDKAVPTINLGINLIAAQLNSEEDSFGPDYDADAKYPTVATNVSTEADLEEVLSEGGWAVLDQDITLSKTLTLDADAKVILDLGGNEIKGNQGTLIKATAGDIVIKNGVIKNVRDNASTTLTSVSLSGDAVAEIKDVTIETTGTGIRLDGNAKITELNADIKSYIDVNGTCAYDAISVNGNARIDVISGGTYTSYLSNKFIDEWNKTHSYSATQSSSIRVNSPAASIGEIKDGTFLGDMDKGNGGATIYVNSGKIEKISGGYFGFTKWGLTNPTKMIFVNSSNGGSIDAIVGGTFEAGNPAYNGAARFGCDFEGIVDASGCRVVDTGTTVEAKVQFSTKVTTYTLNVWEVVSK